MRQARHRIELLTLLSAELPNFVRSNPPSSTSPATKLPLSPEARQFFLTGEPEFADRYFPWFVNIMSPAYWMYLVMAVTVLFNGLKGLSRFWLWRIDAAREKIDAEVREVVGDVVSHAPTRYVSANELPNDQRAHATARDILIRLAMLRIAASADGQYECRFETARPQASARHHWFKFFLATRR